MQSFSLLMVFACVSGVIVHWNYWRRFEFDTFVLKIVLGAVLCYCVLLVTFLFEHDYLGSFARATALTIIHILATSTSICIYRCFYHPLKRFPGPFWARWSMWWKVSNIISDNRHYKFVDGLHDRYGPVVRVGPNHLSINSVEALLAIYGSSSACTKSPLYEFGDLKSLNAERDPHKHKFRRVMWDKALNASACNSFLPNLIATADLLIAKLSCYTDSDILVNNWVKFVTFDVMAELAFSRSWGQLKNEKLHEGVQYCSEYLKYAIVGSQVPWLMATISKIPFIPDPQAQMMAFASKSLDERLKQIPDPPDAMTYVLANKDPSAQQFLNRKDLQSDVFMIQLAGSDTSSSVLVNMLFRLARNPSYQDAIREETQTVFDRSTHGMNWPLLSAAPILNGTIHETLRLHPPVPSGMPRLTPPDVGLDIPPMESESSHLLIPPNTVVSVPTYTVQRDPRHFDCPEDFIPERWSSKPELIKDKRAFCAFSIGAYGCAGRYFALMEIKVIIAKLLAAFNVSFADHEMQMNEVLQKMWLENQADQMTLNPSELRLRFTKR